MSDVNSNIHSRAMLVSLRISTWTARRYDRRVTEKVNRDYAAVKDAGRYNKSLLPGDAASYKAVVSKADEARKTYYFQTLPWSDEGWRLLPTANYLEFTSTLRALRTSFDTALEGFLLDYPELRERAELQLNGMYREEDYPSVATLRHKFDFQTEFSPVPASGDFRLDLASDQVQEIETSVASRVQSAAEMAMRDAWQRLFDAVHHIYDRLSDPNAIFRDSLIENARELVAILPKLNVMEDEDFARMCAEVKTELTILDADTLRDTPLARSSVALEAQSILEKMSTIMGSSWSAS